MNNDENERFDLTIAGFTFGTVSGWDQMDLLDFYYYGFVPNEQFKDQFPKEVCDLSIGLTHGRVDIHDPSNGMQISNLTLEDLIMHAIKLR